ncbi:hypothetical protein [Yoonia sp.]|uniref:hypothetical protein n=1 Tax=Yoonia sp. TaxID=2212373 RepID=UPI0023A6579F|nr:hypothetical protein [Yoonia sp.]MDE0850509.1 hypothetical protein [Yoonia sp.]
MIFERSLVTIALLFVMTVSARAQVAPFIGAGDRVALVQINRGGTGIIGGGGSSLFIGQSGNSLFAPYPKRLMAPIGDLLGRHVSSEARLLQLIASAEAGPDGYDAVQHGASRRPSKRPTDMTIGEIYDWIVATPGQPHAIGRYQFIPDTLRSLVGQAGFDRQTPFTPAAQDQLAKILLNDAGLSNFRSGGLTRHGFMNNLAKIWAGLPTSSGKSYYDGYAGNQATITWARYDTEMKRIYPG